MDLARPSVIRSAVALVCGAAALVFEIAATRALALCGGNTIEVASAAIAAFLAAQAVGAWIGGRIGDRARSLRWPFLGFAVLSAALVATVPAIAGSLQRTPIAETPALELLIQSVLLVFLPALPMGALTPLLVADAEAHRDSGASLGRASGWLYAVNTVGAVLGVIVAAWFAIPGGGIHDTCLFAGALFAGCGVVVTLALRGERIPQSSEPRSRSASLARFSPRWLGLAAGIGASALALEILGARWLAQYHSSSSIAFAFVLAMFLGGIALGSAFGAWRGYGERDVPRLLGWFALAVMATGPIIQVVAHVRDVLVASGVLELALLGIGLPIGAALSGALYSALLRAGSEHAVPAPDDAAPECVGGRRYAALGIANALGSIGGALLAAFVLLPLLGLYLGLWSIALVLAVLTIVLGWRGEPMAARLAIANPLLLGLAFLGNTMPQFHALPRIEGWDPILMHVEGPSANVTVVAGGIDERRATLFVNRVARQGGGDAGERVERRQGLIPGLLHRGPKSALALGVGTGGTLNGLFDAGVVVIDAVEIVPEVIPALEFFQGPYGNLLQQPNITFHSADAVTFLARNKKRYDLIVGDLYFPWTDGASALYSREHFEHARDRLASGGVFCQWLPLHQMRFREFARIATTFRRVFEQTFLVLCDSESVNPIVGLVGSIDVLTLDPDALDVRIRNSKACAQLGLLDAMGLFELYLGDEYTLSAQLDPDGGPGPQLITLDRPDFEYEVAARTESEVVLALNNLDNIARHFVDVPTPYLSLPESWNDEAKTKFDRELRGRAAAFKQYLFGRYWELRGVLAGDDPLGDEQRAADKFAAALVLDAKHPETLAAIERLLFQRFASKRYQQVVDLGGLALRQNTEALTLRRHVGLALLMLGEPEPAYSVFDGDRERLDPLTDTGLAISAYLLARTADAKAAAEHALKSDPASSNRFAKSILAAIEGDREGARRTLEPLLEHEQWGLLARKVAERIEQSS